VRFGKTLVILDVDGLEPMLYPLARRELQHQGSRWVVQVSTCHTTPYRWPISAAPVPYRLRISTIAHALPTGPPRTAAPGLQMGRSGQQLSHTCHLRVASVP
jgi:hypothetical protein